MSKLREKIEAVLDEFKKEYGVVLPLSIEAVSCLYLRNKGMIP